MSTHRNALRLVRGGMDGVAGADAAGARIIAVAAGKGGAGASTAAALIAFAAAAEGRAALLVDAQPMGTLHLMLGVDAGAGLDALREGRAPEQLVTRLGATLDFVAAGDGTVPQAAAERRALFRRFASLFGGYDVVVVDAGARIDAVITAVDAGAEVLLAVSTSDSIGLAASHALFKSAAARPAAPRLAAIINAAPQAAATAALGILDHGVRRFLAHDLLRAGSISEDPAFRAAIAAGMSLVDAAGRSPLLDEAAAVLRTICPADVVHDSGVTLTAAAP